MSKIYNRRSIRLKEYDYSQCGYYYVTICIHNRECNLGKVVNGKIQLSKIGEIVKNEWLNTKQIRKNIDLDEWVVMPNHIHGIIVINDVLFHVGAHCNAPLQTNNKNQFGPQSNNLGAIIRGFKGVTTKRIHSIGSCGFLWQRNYYEHVIRNEIELNWIREYIINNPLQWELDEDNSSKKICIKKNQKDRLGFACNK